MNHRLLDILGPTLLHTRPTHEVHVYKHILNLRCTPMIWSKIFKSWELEKYLNMIVGGSQRTTHVRLLGKCFKTKFLSLCGARVLI